MKRLVRSRDRVLAGVCGGVAHYFGIDPTIIRVVTAILAIVTMAVPVPLIYGVMWYLIPDDE